MNIRNDRWLKRGLIGGLANRNDPIMVSELINFEEEKWDLLKLEDTFDDQTIQEILTIQVRPKSVVDKLCWIGTKLGNYTVKNGYNMLRKSLEGEHNSGIATSSFQTPKSLWTANWNMQNSPKVKYFTWSLCQNAIASKENLWKRKIIPDPMCPICNLEMESVEHIFLLCSWTQGIWSHPNLNIQVNHQGISQFEVWLMQFAEKKTNLPPIEVVASTLWSIWKSRNNLVFRS